MEKTKFAAQVLLIMTVIPVLFIGTLLGNDAHNRTKEHTYINDGTQKRVYVNGRIDPRFIMSCGSRSAYVKK